MRGLSPKALSQSTGQRRACYCTASFAIVFFTLNSLADNNMRILVVGAGATGGYFGARLAQAGRDVTFLVREKRAAALRANGLNVITPQGDFSLAPNIAQAKNLNAPFDLILLTVKSFGLAAALDDIAPAVGANTTIMPVLNGMGHLAVLKQRFGAEAVIGGYCKINATVDADGNIVQMTPLHDIAYGELSGEHSERIRQIDAQFQGIGVNARLADDITREMWEKWLFLSSLGAITCLMRGNIGQVAAASGGKAFATALIHEIAATIKAGGYREREGMVASTINALTDTDSPQTSSMYRDMVQGFAVEADHIIGDLVRIAAAHAVNAPLLNAVYTHLSVYQQAR